MVSKRRSREVLAEKRYVVRNAVKVGQKARIKVIGMVATLGRGSISARAGIIAIVANCRLVSTAFGSSGSRISVSEMPAPNQQVVI